MSTYAPIGLTGGIASGKSTVARLFRSWGAFVADADEISRRALDPGTALICPDTSFSDSFQHQFQIVSARQQIPDLLFPVRLVIQMQAFVPKLPDRPLQCISLER